MANFLIIQSREPFTDRRAQADYELIQNLNAMGNRVQVLLVQNGVIPARVGSIARPFDSICHKSISIYADYFSLRQREIQPEELKTGIQPADVDVVIKALLAGDKVIWH